jgi:hypothetical protein
MHNEMAFDPEQEGRLSAATSIEAFKNALEDKRRPIRRASSPKEDSLKEALHA